MENRTQKFCSIPFFFFQRFDHGAALKIEGIAFDRYASIRNVMHHILVISVRYLYNFLHATHSLILHIIWCLNH